jgi:hypothetical protein
MYIVGSVGQVYGAMNVLKENKKVDLRFVWIRKMAHTGPLPATIKFAR